MYDFVAVFDAFTARLRLLLQLFSEQQQWVKKVHEPSAVWIQEVVGI